MRLCAGCLIAMLTVVGVSSTLAQPREQVGEAWKGERDREFDFWVGEWDVNLRTIQEDLTWKDSIRSKAKIFRILDGKAILELWDEQRDGAAIRGFSLRHYDRESESWVLYLNWPGHNRSGISSLTGSFRHGRGEFFSTNENPDGTSSIERYTFCDVTPTSLRWDDAYSKDGGKTWKNNWIMEFSRTADRAAWPAGEEAALTYYTGERCDLPEFREFERIVGSWEGRATIDGKSAPATLRAYKVLDGCAVISFLEYGRGKERHLEFGFSSYNTYASKLEHARLDNRPGTGLEQLYGARDGDKLILSRVAGEASHRQEWSLDDDDRIELRESYENGKAGLSMTLTRVE